MSRPAAFDHIIMGARSGGEVVKLIISDAVAHHTMTTEKTAVRRKVNVASLHRERRRVLVARDGGMDPPGEEDWMSIEEFEVALRLIGVAL